MSGSYSSDGDLEFDGEEATFQCHLTGADLEYQKEEGPEEGDPSPEEENPHEL